MRKKNKKFIFLLLASVIMLQTSGCAHVPLPYDFKNPFQGTEPNIPYEPYTAQQHNDFGVVYESRGNLPQAIIEYKRAIKKDPTLVKARINLGNVYLKTKEYTKAESTYNEALKLDPSLAEAMNNLAWVYLTQKKKIKEAINLIEVALEKDPADRWIYLDSLSYACYLDGNYQKALALVNEALEKTPDSQKEYRAQELYHLGLIYVAVKENPQKSWQVFIEALNISQDAELKQKLSDIVRDLEANK